MRNYLLFIFGLVVLMTSCGKDNEDKLSAPSTYEFTRDGKSTVGVDGQWKRIDMHGIIKAYANSASSADVDMDTFLKLMKNEGNPYKTDGAFFTAVELNNSGKQLWNKISASGAKKSNQAAAHTYFTNLFKEQARISKLRNKKAASGVAGIAGKRLVDEKGYELIQVISKSIMGANELDQIVNYYLSDTKLDVENDKVSEGKNYTAMEHHWDEAFGYTGLPLNPSLDYSSKGTDDYSKYKRFWSGYMVSLLSSTAGAEVKQKVFDAFLKGRTAILNKDIAERNKYRDIIREQMAKACAIRAVHYLKKGADILKATPGDGEGLHLAAEAIGFVYSLGYTYTGSAEYSKVQTEIAKLVTLREKGLYDTASLDMMLKMATNIATIYGFKVEEAL